LATLAVYLALPVLWVGILSFTPLSRAYLFEALSFAIEPVARAVLFAEPLSLRIMVGVGLILCGLLLVAGWSPRRTIYEGVSQLVRLPRRGGIRDRDCPRERGDQVQ